MNLFSFREQAGLSIPQLAKKINLQPTTYQTYEHGTIRLPADIMLELALLYDISLNSFFVGTSDKLPSDTPPSVFPVLEKQLDNAISSIQKKLDDLKEFNQTFSDYKK